MYSERDDMGREEGRATNGGMRKLRNVFKNSKIYKCLLHKSLDNAKEEERRAYYYGEK